MEETTDSLFGGALTCRQHGRGYRFSLDAVVVARWTEIRGERCVLDLGCGNGIIGLILCRLHPHLHLTGIELQHSLAGLARRNIRDNGLQQRFRILEGDLLHIRDLVPAESFDMVVSNPPYGRPPQGRVSRNREKAQARHELCGRLEDFCRAAAWSLKNRGRMVVVYPAGRLVRLMAALAREHLVVKRLQPVYSYPEDSRARLVLAEAVKNGGDELVVLKPFYVYSSKNGPYSEEMAACYRLGPEAVS